jgi:hypothetical protein
MVNQNNFLAQQKRLAGINSFFAKNSGNMKSGAMDRNPVTANRNEK